jgi:hypothetical protein
MHYSFQWDDPLWTSAGQTITSVEYISKNTSTNKRESSAVMMVPSVRVSGRLEMQSQQTKSHHVIHLPYTVTLSVDATNHHELVEEHVHMAVTLDPKAHDLLSTSFIHTFLVQASNAKEAVYGFGERFTYPNLKGACVPIMAQEQGIGRGQQPLTFFMNRFQDSQGTHVGRVSLIY